MDQCREWGPAGLARMTNSTLVSQDTGGADSSKHVLEDAGTGGAGMPTVNKEDGVKEADEDSKNRPWSGHLELKMSKSFLQLVGFMRARLTDAPGAVHNGGQSFSHGQKGRRKPTRLLVRTLQLGDRKIVRTAKVDIIAKFLYRKQKKIVCQLYENEELKKIDILWSNIKTMHACFDDERFDTLRIEVKSSPQHYRAAKRRTGRYQQWQLCEDYAPRNFYLEFEKGTLERSYGKMLYTDPTCTLLSLSPLRKEDEAQTIGARQVITQQNLTPAPLASLPAAVLPCGEAAPPSAMMSSTNTGTIFTTHDQYGGTKLYDLHNTIPQTYQIQHNMTYYDVTPLPPLQSSLTSAT